MTEFYTDGPWYIWDSASGDFIREAHPDYHPTNRRNVHRWTPLLSRAMAYKNHSLAKRMAQRLRDDGFPRAGVVTAEAARCLELIRRREEAAARCASTTGSRGSGCTTRSAASG